MNESATSLDRLHDIVLPAPVPWWPPAPGWYAVAALLLACIAWLAWRAWHSWRGNAYRRAALRELARLHDVPAIAALLRRTALAAVNRNVVAARFGADWVDWLAAHDTESMSADVRRLLVAGAYARGPVAEQEVAELHAYAAGWIVRHRLPSRSPDPTESMPSEA